MLILISHFWVKCDTRISPEGSRNQLPGWHGGAWEVRAGAWRKPLLQRKRKRHRREQQAGPRAPPGNGNGSEEHLRVPGLRGSCKWREIKARWAAWRQVEKGCVDCVQSQDLSLCPMMNHGSVMTGFLLWVIVLVWCGRREIGNEVRALLRRLLNPEKRW